MLPTLWLGIKVQYQFSLFLKVIRALSFYDFNSVTALIALRRAGRGVMYNNVSGTVYMASYIKLTLLK